MKPFQYSPGLLTSPLDTPVPPGSGGVVLSIVAAVNIAAFAVVTSQGKVADSAVPSQHIGRVIGVAPSAINLGLSGAVVECGEVNNPLWSWTAGDLLYLNGSTISKVPPSTGFVQYLGTSKNSTTMVVELEVPVLL